MIEELISKAGRPAEEKAVTECYAVTGDRDELSKWIDKAMSAKRISQDLFGLLPSATG